jgi:hypothetical protein
MRDLGPSAWHVVAGAADKTQPRATPEAMSSMHIVAATFLLIQPLQLAEMAPQP